MNNKQLAQEIGKIASCLIGKSIKADSGDVALYLNIDEFVQTKSEDGKKAWIPSSAINPLQDEVRDAAFKVMKKVAELVRGVLDKQASFKKTLEKFNLEPKK